jgi:ATP-binding protein involved in chromosome partitioning
MDLKTLPEEIELRSKDLSFLIRWADDHTTIYRMRDLRLACRCAACVDEHTGRPLLDPDAVPGTIEVLGAAEVGNYGIQIQWSPTQSEPSGHNTGIYTFDRLRSLDPTRPEAQNPEQAAP